MDHPHPQPPRHPTERLVGTCPPSRPCAPSSGTSRPLIPWTIPPSPRCCSRARPAPARGWWPTSSMTVARAPRGPSSTSTARPSRRLAGSGTVWGPAGAFTNAKRAKPGLFEAAAGGTLFLDEIDALPLALQSKLLTAIETKRIRRVGAVREQAVDVKVVTASKRRGTPAWQRGVSMPICTIGWR